MSKISKLSSDIPKPEYEFEIQVRGKYTNRLYAGIFRGKIPNVTDRVKADVLRARLNGGMEDSLDPATLMINKMYAYLKFCILEAPQWWTESDDGSKLIDGNIITEVYNLQQDCESEWLQKIWGEEAGTSSDEQNT